MKRVAIYSRKSKFTEKGDSVKNQIQLCKEYIKIHLNSDNTSITVFEDEGFSGASINRPQFQLLLEECKKKKFDVLLCYRLDRISRNIADFTTLIDDLEQYDVSFISIKEQFDTSTPLGRAMMYIASVFSQLERETIAERIKDNLEHLAKSGRWLGGITPTGFESKMITIIDSKGRKRRRYQLNTIEPEVALVKDLFNKFIEFKSISMLESYCLENNIKSKNNKNFYNNTLKNIIDNPVYAIADSKICKYLEKQNHNIYINDKDLNGINGLIAYNKTNQDSCSTRLNNSEWIISVGSHKGIISSDTWLEAAKIRMGSKDINYRKKYINPNSLLSGLLICDDCGSFMRKGGIRHNKDGTIAFYYICELKEKSKRSSCNSKNIRGDKLDEMVLNKLKEIHSISSKVYKNIGYSKLSIGPSQSKTEDSINILNKSIADNNNAISNLINLLSKEKQNLATKYILLQIENIERDNIELKEKICILKQDEQYSARKVKNNSVFIDTLFCFKKSLDYMNQEEREALIRNIVDKIIWDGKNINIKII